MILLIDNREKAPLFAAGPPPGFSAIRRARLITGDYSILGHETSIAIERKMPSGAAPGGAHARDREGG